MAKVIASNIRGVRLNSFPEAERGCDSTGLLQMHPKIVEEYIDKNFDLLPKTEEEKRLTGASSFNALAVSMLSLHSYETALGNLVSGDLFPMRYAFTIAVQNLIKNKVWSVEDAAVFNPRQLNVSWLAVIEKEAKYFLLCRIKGKGILGQDQLHASLYGGAVNADLLGNENILFNALSRHFKKDLGLDVQKQSPDILIDEPDVGMANFGFIAKAEEATIRAAFENTMAKSDAPKISSLALLPISDIPDVKIDGVPVIKNVTLFVPGINGLEEHVEETMEIRPYTKAVIDFIKEGNNLQYIIDAAGF